MKWRRLIWIASVLIAGIAALLLWREHQRQTRFFSEIESAARRYNVDPLLVKAIVWRESGFNPTARGKAGEIGLMQIQEIAAQEWADEEKDRSFQHEHCLNPATNTFAGTFYLSKLLKRYKQTDNPIPYALADYNAGRGNVIRWNDGIAATNSAAFIEQIGFPGTQAYVRTTMRQYAIYRSLARVGWK